jgi:YD repeat-containing protein
LLQPIENNTYGEATDPAPADYVGSSDPDKDLILRTVYDVQGRVWKTFDDRGNETRYAYDVLGRQVQVITNYMNGRV